MTRTVFSLALLGLLPFAQASNSTGCSLDTLAPSKQLVWCPCEDEYFCARLDVPLDYQNPGLGRASVPLRKYPADPNSTRGPYQGMILINPGGPGASGADYVLEAANILQNVAGSNWDIVGFDPRGMFLSEPVADCSVTKTAQNTTLNRRTVPRVPDGYYDSVLRLGTDMGSECAARVGGELDAGPHMSTATTARDMLSIVDAFAATEDGRRASKPSSLLNYYGVSYGTFLGQTFASMFPERVGNMVLDGVVEPEDYLTNLTYKSVNHLDGVVAGFFLWCHQIGPSECSYYTGSSPGDIYERFNQSYARLDAEKAKEENWANATEIETALLVLKVGLLTASYVPAMQFGMLSDALVILERAISRDQLSAWNEEAVAIWGDPYGADNGPFLLGVLCSDQGNRWYNKTLDDFRPLLAELERQSILGDIWARGFLGCNGWSIKATEIFTGPFVGNTETPILFVGNTYDPATPLENALSSSKNYKDAQTIIVDGFGHTAMNTRSPCAFSKILRYFQTGEMPGNDSFCAFDGRPLGGISLNGTLKENIFQAGLSNLLS